MIRSNYSDESLTLMAYLAENAHAHANTTYVVYIETGWEAHNWLTKVEQGEVFAQRLGFTPIRLKSKASFAQLVEDRKRFPSKKFQWCAGFLKGLPLLEWLDLKDPDLQWIIALPKRQAMYRAPIVESITECPYHGERTVLHPIRTLTNSQKDTLLQKYGLIPTYQRSKECDPCVHSSAQDLLNMTQSDIDKTIQLERVIDATMYTSGLDKLIREIAMQHKSARQYTMDSFSMGCGDPFGCGL
ncbi:MAG TPA: hypothetical protein VFP93_02950 [Gammaproteobacteria bacterium]|nr:hypothetical protein [Gammaproteobacteria bacterium]